jgi:hypothetical protein
MRVTANTLALHAVTCPHSERGQAAPSHFESRMWLRCSPTSSCRRLGRCRRRSHTQGYKLQLRQEKMKWVQVCTEAAGMLQQQISGSPLDISVDAPLMVPARAAVRAPTPGHRTHLEFGRWGRRSPCQCSCRRQAHCRCHCVHRGYCKLQQRMRRGRTLGERGVWPISTGYNTVLSPAHNYG